MFAFLCMMWLVPRADDLSFERPVHTYSIVAYDAATGEVGAAVQSHWFSVGSVVIWTRPGVGAVATQSFVNPDYGPLGLDAMAAGQAPAEALAALRAKDEGRDVRQVAMVDVKGRVAGSTGAKCIDYACDIQGESFSVQANIMLKDTVCAAMAAAYRGSAGKPLAERLLLALQAAEAEGGDLRGKQSAAIQVVKAAASAKPWTDTVVSLRVEDHPEPIKELTRLYGVQRAYDFMNQGDLHLEHGKIDEAMNSYRQAVGMLPGRVEPIFWQAVNLVAAGQLEQALPMFAEVFKHEPNWKLMPARLVKVGLLPSDAKIQEAIAKQGN